MNTINGNILEVTSGILVHGCNTTKAPEGGFAHALFAKYPQARQAHYDLLDYHDPLVKAIMLGKFSVCKVSDTLVIINAITQTLPGAGTLSYDAIHKVFAHLPLFSVPYDETLPIIFPKIGAGIAGGEWSIIEAIIDATIGHLDHRLYVL